ncbi:MAG: hypothetical protein K8R21_08245 [Leptospira sp.]|nr:hypothetical protein [Leptospira sp.]
MKKFISGGAFTLFISAILFQYQYLQKQWKIESRKNGPGFFQFNNYVASLEKTKPFLRCDRKITVYHTIPENDPQFDANRIILYSLSPCEIEFRPACNYNSVPGFHIVHKSCPAFSKILNGKNPVKKISDELILLENPVL